LSRQHQHALALCVRINRAPLSTGRELDAWQAEIQQHFEQEIQYHFAAEEAGIFPAAQRFPELRSLVEELVADHAQLRNYFTSAMNRTLDREALRQFAELLSTHIRKEERQLFEKMQERLTQDELQKIGVGLDATLAAAPQTCIVPAETTLNKSGS
jgi:hemerythrin-like domain-containing protein